MNLTDAKAKKVPRRTCIGCRQAFDKRELLRVVRAPSGEVFVDKTGKADGRGAYVCSDAKCAQKCAKGLLRKHLNCDIPSEVYEEINLFADSKK